MPDANNEALEKNGAAQGGSKHGNIFVVLFGIAVMLIAPTASYFVVRTTLKTPEPDVPAENQDAENPVTFPVESLVVNVAGTRMTRILRMEPHLILSDATLAEYLKEIEPIIKDRIMEAAGRRTLEQLETPEDREALKRDIATEINTMIQDRMSGTVLDVVFSDFLIQ